MAVEDFTTYTEVDEGSKVTVTAPLIAWNDLQTKSDKSYVTKSKGLDRFVGDFQHTFFHKFFDIQNLPFLANWMIANMAGDIMELVFAAEDFVFYGQSSETIVLEVMENGVCVSFDTSVGVSGQKYFVVLSRDDDAGPFGCGLYAALIYKDSILGDLHDVIAAYSSAGEQNDFEYIYGLAGYDLNLAGHTADGFTLSLDLHEALYAKSRYNRPYQRPIKDPRRPISLRKYSVYG